MATLTINIVTKPVGKKFISATKLAGIVVAGELATDEELAVKNLLWALAGQSTGNRQADMALTLALAGQSLEELALPETNG